VIIAAPLALAFGATPSGADTSPATGGWYWAGQPDAQPPPVGALPAPVPTPDVPDGDVAAGYRPTGIDKETFLHVASEVGDGATVSSVVLTIKEDNSGVNVSPDAAVINAKPVGGFWLDGAKGAPTSQAPSVLENPSVAGKRNADGTWTFDLTSLAQQWASGTIQNNGIALIPDQSGGTFQVGWKLDSASVAVEGGSDDPSASLNLGAFSSDSSSTPTDSSSTGAVGDLSSSAPLSADIAPAANLSGDVVATAPTAAPASSPAAPPQVALGSNNSKKAVSKGGLPAGFFIAVLAGIGLLGGVSIALGDLGEPDLPREGSVVRRLERRAAPSN
jgi:hypothetical protein